MRRSHRHGPQGDRCFYLFRFTIYGRYHRIQYSGQSHLLRWILLGLFISDGHGEYWCSLMCPHCKFLPLNLQILSPICFLAYWSLDLGYRLQLPQKFIKACPCWCPTWCRFYHLSQLRIFHLYTKICSNWFLHCVLIVFVSFLLFLNPRWLRFYRKNK